MNQSKLSIIVPVYNVCKYLDKCVDSLINQSYSNIEIILVDDGSKDSSSLICDEWAKKDSRIKVIHQINGGLSDARNTGINNSSGEYLAFIDSDDFVKNTMFEEMMDCFTENVDIVCCDFQEVYENDEIIYKNSIKENNADFITKYTSNELLDVWYGKKNTVYTVSWNKIYKKNLFQNIRFPKGRIHEDEYTTYKLVLESRNILILNKKLYFYLKRDNSITALFNENRLHSLDAYQERLEISKEKKLDFFYFKTVIAYLSNIIFLYFNFKKSNKLEISNQLNNLFKNEFNKYNKLLKIDYKNQLKFRLFIFNKIGYCLFVKCLEIKSKLSNY